MKSSNTTKTARPFVTIRPDIDCVFFEKTQSPVDPVEFVRRICEDARTASHPNGWKSRYLNRITPVSLMDKASESGLDKVAREVLAPWFSLRVRGQTTGDEPSEAQETEQETVKAGKPEHEVAGAEAEEAKPLAGEDGSAYTACPLLPHQASRATLCREVLISEALVRDSTYNPYP
jgi:tRNA acetyltransferase TAN1